MNSILLSNKARSFEIFAVILTALCKFVVMDYLKWRLPFIATAITLWALYVIYQCRTNPGIAKYWGFRTDNFTKVAKMILPYGGLSVVIFLGIGFCQDTIQITWHIVPILILYPIWGIIQQYMLIALILGNLQDYKNLNFDKRLIVVFSALLFGLIHYPFVWLIAATFILAIFYGVVYLRERNIYVLGIFHGWLGALFYYTVLNRDPFVETFGRLVHIVK